MEYLADAVDALIETHCQSAATDEWDVDGLSKELALFWPTTLTADRLADARSTDDLYELVMAEATAHYAKREEELGTQKLVDADGSTAKSQS